MVVRAPVGRAGGQGGQNGPGDGGAEGAEPDGGGAVGQPDARHAGRGAALRADRGRGEAEQLGVAGDEDKLGVVAGQVGGADDPVVVFEGDQLELIAVRRVVGLHALDDAGRGAERHPAGLAAVERRQGEYLLAVGQARHELPDRVAGGQHARRARRHSAGRQGGNLDDADPDHPARARHRADRGPGRGRDGARGQVGRAGPLGDTGGRGGGATNSFGIIMGFQRDTGQQAGLPTAPPGRGRRSPRAGRRRSPPRRPPSGPCDAGCRTSWRRRTSRR